MRRNRSNKKRLQHPSATSRQKVLFFQTFETKSTISNYPETFTKCYNELGCVSATEDWFHDKFRPINLKPLDRQVIQTEFVLLIRNRTSRVVSVRLYLPMAQQFCFLRTQSLAKWLLPTRSRLKLPDILKANFFSCSFMILPAVHTQDG